MIEYDEVEPVMVTVRMDPAFRDQFYRKCQSNEETASAVIRRMMKDYVANRIRYDLSNINEEEK